MKRFIFRLALISSCVCLAHPVPAASRGDEVVVVYNNTVPGSETVARHYAAVRHVPKDQVIGFELSKSEEISREEYESSLARPLARELEERKLWRMGTNILPVTNTTDRRELPMPVESKVRYVVLCYGVPLKIKNDPNLHEPGEEAMRPELRLNAASVDSELAVLPLPVEMRKATGLLRNPYYMTTNASLLNPTNGILLVTRLDGPSPEIADHLVDKAVEAEDNGFWGRAYCDIRSVTDTNYLIGDTWIRRAYDICRAMGFESYLDTNAATLPASFPMSHIAFYAGWYDGSVSGPFLAPQVEFMPGAFAYHLHSANANSIRTTNRFWVGPLLAKGATCTMGSVNEPYLLGTPDIGTFTARWLINGFTFGEAAYAAQNGLSWQTTVIGDPLYRPFAMPPQLLELKLERTQSPLLSWMYLRIANMNIARGTPLMQVTGFLEELPLTKRSAVLMEKLGDLDDEVGKPASTLYSYRQALKLDPSPEQKLRLLLKLAKHQAAQKHFTDARDTYRTLLHEFPDYPGKAEIVTKLIDLGEIPTPKPATNAITEAIQELQNALSTNHPAK